MDGSPFYQRSCTVRTNVTSTRLDSTCILQPLDLRYLSTVLCNITYLKAAKQSSLLDASGRPNMASSRVSSMLDRFKFEQKPEKKIRTFGSASEDGDSKNSRVSSVKGESSQRHGREMSRPSTPESDAVRCIPETPSSDLPESIESGSPVFPPSSAKRREAQPSQRSLVSSAISSLLSPDTGVGDKSPTFGKSKSLLNGNTKKSSSLSSFRRINNKQLHFTDSDSESESEGVTSKDSQSHDPAGQRSSLIKSRSGCSTDSDSTHITNLETQDSLETVIYSFEESPSKLERHASGGLKRKRSSDVMAMMNGRGDDEMEEKEEEEEGEKEKQAAVEQLQICFPGKSKKELQRVLLAFDWNVNRAANSLMQDTSGTPKKMLRNSPEMKKATKLQTAKSYQSAFSGWLEKPSTSSPAKRRRVISSSDDEVKVDQTEGVKKKSQAKRTYQRIRTFSSDSTDDVSPVKKPTKKGEDLQKASPARRAQRIETLSGEEDNDEGKEEEEEGAKKNPVANGFYKKGPAQSGKKPFRKVWAGFLPEKKEPEEEKKKKAKTVKKLQTVTKPQMQRKPRRYSDSDDDRDADLGDSDSEYEEEQELTPEFQAMVESFFNSATIEELISIDGCSKAKADKIVAMRPFTSFTDLLERLEDSKNLGSVLLWNCETLFHERRTMEDLMKRCNDISGRIQRTVTSVMQSTASSDECQLARQPSLLNQSMQLKPYQLVGLNWLKLMHTQKVNGILADEMGLGKTIQVIAFLAHLLEEGSQGPHLIVAPSSTLDNWLRELQTWCPALQVTLYHGSQQDRQEIRDNLLYEDAPCNVIVTSYNLCTSSADDRSLFRKLPLQYSIFDEGHMLKNMKSQRFGHLMKIKAERRLLLTGTPLQNNLQELISLLSFTLPSMFGCKAEQLTRVFCMKKQKTSNPHEQSSYEMERIAHAKKIMQPFVLRRLKIDVLSQLPKKVERVEHVKMTESQQKSYDNLKMQISRDIKSGNEMSAGKMTSAMMELRKLANHPLLLRYHYDDPKLRKMAKLMLKEPSHYDANEEYIFEDMQVMSDFELHRLCHEYSILTPHKLDKDLVAESGKFRHLDHLLQELIDQGSRVLLFSQFVMVLDIVEEYLRLRKHKFIRLDGSTQVSERSELIDRFNEDDSVFIFLLSTKAGGVGINLTAANTVILHDIDFNPYNDKQAEDRCHRVGQTRDVTVIRMVSKATIEEGMLSCANYKLKLEQQMTSGITGEEGADEAKDIARLLRDALDV